MVGRMTARRRYRFDCERLFSDVIGGVQHRCTDCRRRHEVLCRPLPSSPNPGCLFIRVFRRGGIVCRDNEPMGWGNFGRGPGRPAYRHRNRRIYAGSDDRRQRLQRPCHQHHAGALYRCAIAWNFGSRMARRVNPIPVGLGRRRGSIGGRHRRAYAHHPPPRRRRASVRVGAGRDTTVQITRRQYKAPAPGKIG